VTKKSDEIALAEQQLAQFSGTVGPDDVWRLLLADKSPDTRAAYEYDLGTFARFLDLPADEAARWLLTQGQGNANRVVHAYQAWLYEQPIYAPRADPATSQPVRIGYAPASVNRKINALRSVVKLARFFNVVSWDLEVRLRPVENVRDTDGPDEEGYAAILNTLEDALTEARVQHDNRAITTILRDRVLIRLLGDRGIRRSEVAQITWPNGVVLSPPKVEFIPKGRRIPKWRAVSDECGFAIDAYLAVRTRKPGYLLLPTRGADGSKPLSLSSMNRRVTYWSAKAGCPTTPHGLRHYAITRFCELCEDEHARLEFSGHKDGRSLRRYNDRNYEDVVREHMQRVANPLADEEPDQ